MDWATATFFDRTIHDLWLDPDKVTAEFDLESLRQSQSARNDALVNRWQAMAPASDASVIEFDFLASGSAKRKLRRRLHGHILLRRGGFRLRKPISLKWLGDYALAYEILAQICGGALLGWDYIASPLTE